jgi:hypothetical protein
MSNVGLRWLAAHNAARELTLNSDGPGWDCQRAPPQVVNPVIGYERMADDGVSDHELWGTLVGAENLIGPA